MCVSSRCKSVVEILWGGFNPPFFETRGTLLCEVFDPRSTPSQPSLETSRQSVVDVNALISQAQFDSLFLAFLSFLLFLSLLCPSSIFCTQHGCLLGSHAFSIAIQFATPHPTFALFLPPHPRPSCSSYGSPFDWRVRCVDPRL